MVPLFVVTGSGPFISIFVPFGGVAEPAGENAVSAFHLAGSVVGFSVKFVGAEAVIKFGQVDFFAVFRDDDFVVVHCSVLSSFVVCIVSSVGPLPPVDKIKLL